MQGQPQPTPVTTQPAVNPTPYGWSISLPEAAAPSSGILLMLTFCVWLLRQQAHDN